MWWLLAICFVLSFTILTSTVGFTSVLISWQKSQMSQMAPWSCFERSKKKQGRLGWSAAFPCVRGSEHGAAPAEIPRAGAAGGQRGGWGCSSGTLAHGTAGEEAAGPGRAEQDWARPPPGGAGQGGTREIGAGFVRRAAGVVMKSEARRAGEGGPARQPRQQPALRSMAAASPRSSPRWALSSPPCHRQCHCHASPGAPGLRARTTETQPAPGQRSGAGDQVRAGGRWCRGQDQPGGQLHHQRVSRRVPAHRPRHLLR